jgi:hypothetical protein
MADWGQGALNNNIGWGQGADNNIGWGSIYNISYSGDVIISGLINQIENIISSFKTRVSNNIGTFESEQSLRDILTNLYEIQ